MDIVIERHCAMECIVATENNPFVGYITLLLVVKKFKKVQFLFDIIWKDLCPKYGGPLLNKYQYHSTSLNLIKDRITEYNSYLSYVLFASGWYLLIFTLYVFSIPNWIFISPKQKVTILWECRAIQKGRYKTSPIIVCHKAPRDN